LNPDFAFDDVTCFGNESSLAECTFKDDDDDCGAKELAGVVCEPGEL
jgi:hypothetical protein